MVQYRDSPLRQHENFGASRGIQILYMITQIKERLFGIQLEELYGCAG
jgi:hypothetical protein